MSNELSYRVNRVVDEVFYSVYRGSELVTERNVTWLDLSTFKAVFRCSIGDEKCIGFQLERAHELAKEAVSNMVRLEKEF